MKDEDVINCVRKLRRLITTLDSIGFPVHELMADDELKKLIAKRLPERFLDVSSDMHQLVQNIEKSKRYKEVIKKLCRVETRD